MSMNVENSVRERYSEGARERQEALCCPVDYDAGLLNGHTHDLLTGHAYKGGFISLSVEAKSSARCESEPQNAQAQQSDGGRCC